MSKIKARVKLVSGASVLNTVILKETKKHGDDVVGVKGGLSSDGVDDNDPEDPCVKLIE